MIYRIEKTTSTNDDAREAKYVHGDVIWAEQQTAGRGQRGHKWDSATGDNLTFSTVLAPTFLPVDEQFLLSEVVALALTETFARHGIEAKIKWTNDIYADDRKIVGVLIEHMLSSERFERTIVGTGINVNQTEFDPLLPNPVSMRQLTGMRYDREAVLEVYLDCLTHYYDMLHRGDKQTIQRLYRERMYHIDEEHTYALPSGERFRATIRGVRPSGELRLEHADGTIREYAFKEVEFVLPGRDGMVQPMSAGGGSRNRR
jgi:BirA family biotin operon repressor/biotin-[acetyl-CoA-carboxylase] ligase